MSERLPVVDLDFPVSANDVFKGFLWPVLSAFSDALLTCRFSAGDCLYDHKAAYSMSWSEACKHVRQAIQITFPNAYVSSEQQQTPDYDMAVATNWGSTVKFVLKDVQSGESREVTTTQGRLYTFLWHGDASDLEMSKPSPIPGRLADAHRDLSEIALDESVTRFLMVVDAASPYLRGKVDKVKVALPTDTKLKALPISLLGNQYDSPTRSIACFETTLPVSGALPKIVSALYTPMSASQQRKRKSEKEYRPLAPEKIIGMHGCLTGAVEAQNHPDLTEIIDILFKKSNAQFSIQYIDRDGVKSERIIQPLGLTNHGDKYGIRAFCQTRGAQRTFRLDRIQGIPRAI